MKAPFFTTGTRLPAIDLELLHPGRTRRHLGWLILVCGLALATLAAAHYLHAIRLIAEMETGLNPPLHEAEAVGKGANEDETKAVQAALARLALPWGTLFSALEKSPADDIALLAVEPNADAGTVRIVAEAPDAYVMLDYVRALSIRPVLKEVSLVGYEIADKMPEPPMRFTLAATWRATP